MNFSNLSTFLCERGEKAEVRMYVYKNQLNFKEDLKI